MSKHTPTVHLSVFLLLEKEGELLWALRDNTGWSDGMWSLVSGHVEAGEEARSALAREAFEEIGIEIAPSDLEVLYVAHHMSDRENVSLYMRPTKWRGEPWNKEPHKCGGLKFFPKDAIPQPVVPYVKGVVEAIARGENYGSSGFDR